MQCNSCGAMIPSGANNCPNCGVSTRNPGTFQESTFPALNSPPDKTVLASPYTPGPFQETPLSQPAPQADKPMLEHPRTPPLASSEYFGEPSPQPAQPPISSNSQQTSYPGVQGFYGVPQVPFPTPPQRLNATSQQPSSPAQPQQGFYPNVQQEFNANFQQPSQGFNAPSTQLPSSPAQPPQNFNAPPQQPSQGFYTAPQPSSASQERGYYANAPQSSSPTHPQAAYNTASQPPYAAPPSTFSSAPQPMQRKSGLTRSIGVLIAIVVVLFILSGFALLYYSTVYHPAQLHAQATSTAQTQQTRIANATAVAKAQATGTAVAYTNATSTAQAIVTANAQATTTALQSIYTSATSGTPVLSDSLASNSGSGWTEGQANGGGGCNFTGGAYHASLDQKGFYLPCFAQNTNFSNFAFQVEMTIVRGDGGGLVFRANSGGYKFYLLSFTQNGTYDLALIQDSTHSTALGFGQSTSFKQNAGQQNLITLVARDGNMYIYVNKQYAGIVTDSTYKSGQIGVMVNAHTTASDVAFQNAQLWRL